VGCFFNDQEMDPLAISNMKPPTEWHESGSWAQFESVQPTKSVELWSLHPKVSNMFAVPFK
jgi:hypothetical protein